MSNVWASGQPISSASLQQLINAQHAGWVAKDNWVTELPREQIQRMLGVQHPPQHDLAFRMPEHTAAELGLPVSLDWRNKDGVDWTSPILNQGNCGSCVAFSTIGTLETQYNITSGIPGFNPEFSAQALFVCGGGACEFGWQPDLAAQYLQSTGVPDEACVPETMGSTGVTPDCSLCSDASSRTYKTVGYTAPTSGTVDLDAIRQALAQGPLMTTLTVYDDFLYYTGGVYKHVTGEADGGHAVSIVGYDDSVRAFIIRNSWGTNWGEKGFIRVSYDDISGIGDETWQLDLQKASGYIELSSPRNRDTFSGSGNLHATSTFAGTKEVDFDISDTTGRAIQTVSCHTSDCPLPLDTTKLKDGAYTISATAQSSALLGKSMPATFYVINGTPKLGLSFTGQGVDLTQPLTDRIVFNVAMTSSIPVPFSNLTFHVAQNGKDVYTNSTNMVVNDGMTMGWRTGNVPNGTYQIYFTGQIAPTGKAPFSAKSSLLTVSVNNPPAS